MLIAAAMVGGVLCAAPRPAGAAARTAARGTLALLNLRSAGWQVAQSAQQELQRSIGGWATQPGIAALLAGRANPGALPAGRPGVELTQLVDELRRERHVSTQKLFELGKLLGVDYLLVLRVEPRALSARLFSVHRQRFAPQGFEGADHRVAPLAAYIAAQVKDRAAPRKRWGRWWMWAAAAGVAAVTIGLAAASDDTSGDLRIRIRRD